MHVQTMCFGVLINRPERSLLGCIWSKPMFGLIVDINFSPNRFDEYIFMYYNCYSICVYHFKT